MLEILNLFWFIGCIMAVICMIIVHNTLGKTDEYYRIHIKLLPLSVAVIMSWFAVYVYFKHFYFAYKDKPKDSCKKD